MRSAQEPGAVHDVGNAALDGRQELHIVAGVVLEVRVLNENDLATGSLEASPQRRALAGIARLEQDAQPVRIERLPVDQQLSSAIRGAVVNDDDLLVNGDALDAVQDLFDCLALVVNRDHNGELDHRCAGPYGDVRTVCGVSPSGACATSSLGAATPRSVAATCNVSANNARAASAWSDTTGAMAGSPGASAAIRARVRRGMVKTRTIANSAEGRA
jgi:hypothetical protein